MAITKWEDRMVPIGFEWEIANYYPRQKMTLRYVEKYIYLSI